VLEVEDMDRTKLIALFMIFIMAFSVIAYAIVIALGY
jgi:hypothetical protein